MIPRRPDNGLATGRGDAVTRWVQITVGRGFTLAECLIAAVVLAGAVIAISAALSAAYQQTSGQVQTSQAVTLAQQLMEEIASHPLRLPDGSGGQEGWSSGCRDRRLYDTVDDYNGYMDDSAVMQTLDGQTLSAFDGASYVRSVSITMGARPAGHTAPPTGDTALVSVTVTPPAGQSVTIQKLVAATTLTR
jgi:type II secretory pathway pseudopilin PulG